MEINPDPQQPLPAVGTAAAEAAAEAEGEEEGEEEGREAAGEAAAAAAVEAQEAWPAPTGARPLSPAAQALAMSFSLDHPSQWEDRGDDEGDTPPRTPSPPSPPLLPVRVPTPDLPALEDFPPQPCSTPPPPPTIPCPLPELTAPATFAQLQEYAAVGYAAAGAVRRLLLGPVEGYVAAAREGMWAVLSADLRDRRGIPLEVADTAEVFAAQERDRSESSWRTQIALLLAIDKCVRPVVWTEAVRMRHEATGSGVLPMVDYPLFPWDAVQHPGGCEQWLRAAMAMGRGSQLTRVGVSVTAHPAVDRTRAQFPLWVGESYIGHPQADVMRLLGVDEPSWTRERQRDLLRTARTTWDDGLAEASARTQLAAPLQFHHSVRLGRPSQLRCSRPTSAIRVRIRAV